ncbi:peptide-N-glycosidase F-related protein [Pseudofulvibacter geojedonensis]|uniref:Peptide-N-glycosidase F-related protein n=1 Tax=Pseudofulvibacter geojedonensis TaxID=1123758 RepID=A0ABW3I3V7_9FLAO
MKRLPHLFFTILTFALLSCGGSDDSGSGGTTPPDPIAPAMTSTSNISYFGDVLINQSSASQSITIQSSGLTADISVTISDNNFKISLDGSTYSDTLTIPFATANSGNQQVYVRFSPLTVGDHSGQLVIESTGVTTITKNVSGSGVPITHNYVAFNEQPIAFGGGYNQSATQTFTLHPDLDNIAEIKMFLQIDCPTSGCDDWDRFANVKVKDPATGNWFEIGRYITPYWVGTELLERGLEFDVTDFKSLLTGSVELRIYIENWTPKADLITVDFDFIEGTPDYPYYSVAEVLPYHINSIDGVPYGESHNFDLDKQVTIPANAESTHLRTTISGWGHATPYDSGNRPCAEWCFRTHDVKIDGANTFQHYMGPMGCASNPINNQAPGNWMPDRAGWCPGMAVPNRIDTFGNSMAGSTFTFEYDYEDWTNDTQNGNAYYATSTYVIVKSNTAITAPTVN